MDVAKADAGALGAGGGVLPGGVQQPFHHLGGHSGAVVRNLDEHILPLPAGPHGNLPVPVGKVHAVVDGVFQNGLDDELDGVESLYTILRQDVGGEFVFIAHLLDGQVVPGVLQLVGDGNQAAAPA